MQRKRSINAEPDLNIDLMQFKLDFLYRSNSHCIWFVSFVISLSCLVLIMRTILATNDFLAFLFCLKQRCLFSFSLTTKLKETSLFLIKQHFKQFCFFSIWTFWHMIFLHAKMCWLIEGVTGEDCQFFLNFNFVHSTYPVSTHFSIRLAFIFLFYPSSYFHCACK